MATTPLHTISISIMNAGSRHSCILLIFFLSTTKKLFIIRLCVLNCNQDDNSKWPPPLGQQMGDLRHHLCLKSLVCFLFYFIYICFFFFFYCSLPHHYYHPQQQKLEMHHISSPGKVFFASFFTFLILLIECHHTI